MLDKKMTKCNIAMIIEIEKKTNDKNGIISMSNILSKQR